MNAEQLNELGRQQLSRGEYEQARGHFQEAARRAPDWSVPFYNLGLVTKFEGRWEDSLQANWRAFQLYPEDEATFWNLAIASVAVGDWERAALAFQAIGLELPEGDPPWDFRMGLIPIRVAKEEVVWCHRLDPVRGRIANIPLPRCGRRFRDVVLNDGEPVGSRIYQGREVPVFNELMLLERSSFETVVAELLFEQPEAVADLIAFLGEHGVPAEDWSSSVRMLCKACSEGRPHEHHDRELKTEWEPQRRLGLAVQPQVQPESLLAEFRRVKILRLGTD